VSCYPVKDNQSGRYEGHRDVERKDITYQTAMKCRFGIMLCSRRFCHSKPVKKKETSYFNEYPAASN
jgi:hypothetical protein